MKLINKPLTIIGDDHGREDWREIATEAILKFRHVIFVGDYVDSYDIRPIIIKHNLKAIIEFKIKHPDNVTLLIGNHDWGYIFDETSISGFNWQIWQEYKQLFNDNIDLFDIAWGYTNHKTKKYTLVTHAGLTRNFYNTYILPRLCDPKDKLYKLTEGSVMTQGVKESKYKLHEILNFMKGDSTLWKVGRARGGMGSPGPLWADHSELLSDPYPDINQIFGHTANSLPCIDQFGDYFLAKVDGWNNEKLASMHINI